MVHEGEDGEDANGLDLVATVKVSDVDGLCIDISDACESEDVGLVGVRFQSSSNTLPQVKTAYQTLACNIIPSMIDTILDMCKK